MNILKKSVVEMQPMPRVHRPHVAGAPVDLDEAVGRIVLEQAEAQAAPPSPVVALPPYVQHVEGATRAGMLSAQAMVNEFEATAKEIEAIGVELQAAKERAEAGQVAMTKALEDLRSTAAAYRTEAARLLKQIEEVAIKTSEASALCAQLRERIATPEA